MSAEHVLEAVDDFVSCRRGKNFIFIIPAVIVHCD